MSAPDDLERRRHHRQARPTSHWGKPDDLAPHPGPVDRCNKCRDQRDPGEVFCATCPDHEACATGYPCGLVKHVNGGAA